MLKVSAFYLEKQKSSISKEKFFWPQVVSKHAKREPNFQLRFGTDHQKSKRPFWLGYFGLVQAGRYS